MARAELRGGHRRQQQHPAGKHPQPLALSPPEKGIQSDHKEQTREKTNKEEAKSTNQETSKQEWEWNGVDQQR